MFIKENHMRLVYIFLLFFTSLAFADMEERLDRVERNISLMQKEMFTKSSSSTVSSNNFEGQLEDIYKEIKTLRGQLEQLQFENSKLNEKFIKFTSDIEYRLNNSSPNSNSQQKGELSGLDNYLENDQFLAGSDQEALEKKTEQSSEKADKVMTKDSPDNLYNAAMDSITKKDYKKSEQLFSSFISKFPDYPMIDEAYFWLGESYYHQSNYEKAATAYLAGYKKKSKGPKAQDNLLKLAESLSKLLKTKESCMTLVKLKKEFPDASIAIKKRAVDLKKYLKCE